jgi:uncharacterized cupin superfamily protein
VSEPNALEPEWDVEFSEPPLLARAMRLGARAGARELGATLYEIDPGGTMAPYHAHHGNEELLLVLSGTPELRTPDGTRELAAGATVAFVRGPAGAHSVVNRSGGPVRLLIFSTMNYPEVDEHLDTGTWLAVLGPQEGKAFPAGGDVPFMDSLLNAIRAAPAHEREPPAEHERGDGAPA